VKLKWVIRTGNGRRSQGDLPRWFTIDRYGFQSGTIKPELAKKFDTREEAVAQINAQVWLRGSGTPRCRRARRRRTAP
jgi:hypothetical protein